MRSILFSTSTQGNKFPSMNLAVSSTDAFHFRELTNIINKNNLLLNGLFICNITKDHTSMSILRKNFGNAGIFILTSQIP